VFFWLCANQSAGIETGLMVNRLLLFGRPSAATIGFAECSAGLVEKVGQCIQEDQKNGQPGNVGEVDRLIEVEKKVRKLTSIPAKDERKISIQNTPASVAEGKNSKRRPDLQAIGSKGNKIGDPSPYNVNENDHDDKKDIVPT
jgi:hypothetical protein